MEHSGLRDAMFVRSISATQKKMLNTSDEMKAECFGIALEIGLSLMSRAFGIWTEKISPLKTFFRNKSYTQKSDTLVHLCAATD